MSYTPRLKEKYTKEIVPVLKEKFKYKSIMEVPMVEKIVISQGVGEAVSDRKLIENAVNDLSEIAGQKALIVNSKKDVSNFKLTIVTTANTTEEGKALLVEFGFPFEKK